VKIGSTMNRLQILLVAFVALGVCVASGQEIDEHDDDFSRAGFFPSDDDELSTVNEENKAIFSDFCLRARDQFRSIMSQKTNEGAAKTFQTLFSTLQGVATETMAAQQEAVERGVQALKEGKKGFGEADSDHDGKLTEGELQNKVVEKASEQTVYDDNGNPIEPGLIARFTSAIFKVVHFMFQVAVDEASLALARYKSQLSLETLTGATDMACTQLQESILKELEGEFSSELKSLQSSASGPKNRQLRERLNTLSLKDVNCLTTRRLLVLSRWCVAIKAIAPVVGQVVSMSRL